MSRFIRPFHFQTANLVLNKNGEAIQRLRRFLTADAFLRLPVADRKALVLCLLCLAYPFIYDGLITLGGVFKLQDFVSRNLLHQRISSLYGSNRSVYVGVGELLSTLLDMGLLVREKRSVYSKLPSQNIQHRGVAEFHIYTEIKMSKSNSLLTDELRYRPWFSWFDISGTEIQTTNILKSTDSTLGNGYLKSL